MIAWFQNRSQAKQAKKLAEAVWREEYANRVLSMATNIATSIEEAGSHPQTSRVAQGLYVSGQFPDFSAMLYAPELAEANGQNIGEVIGKLELFANEASSADQQLATYIWAFTLRAYVNERFRSPVVRIWAVVRASPEYIEGTAPEYVKEWLGGQL